MFRKYIYPLFLILLCLALLLGGAGFFFFLTQYHPNAPKDESHLARLSVVILDDAWADEAFASADPETQSEAIAAALANVQALGGNAVALSGRLSDGSALFCDKTETLSTATTVAENSSFFNRYDAFATLIAAASEQGIEVLLMPTDAGGKAIKSDALLTAPSFITTLADAYGMRLLTDEGVLLGEAYSAETYLVQTLTDGEKSSEQMLYTVLDNPALAALSLVQKGADVQLVLGNYTTLLGGANAANTLFAAYYQDGAALPDLSGYLGEDYARSLAITYPTEDGSTVTTSKLFLVGTSNPDSPLTLNGEAVQRHGTEGVWGVLVNLESGENIFTLENGADTLAYTIRYKKGGGGGGGSSGTANYYTLPEGQTIQITSAIASALSNAYNASTITQTLYQGAVVGVKQYVSKAGSTEAYAYQLMNGDWVRASYCTLHDTEKTHLTEAGVAFDDETRASVLTFMGGTPAVYHSWEGSTLTLTLMNASYSGSALHSDWFSSAVSIDGNGNTIFTVSFTESEPLFGWAVNYDTEANTTTLTLKQTPRLSADETKPLAGVRVLLDAGHGLDDLGAMGAGGLDAPCEKDVNLALTMAATHRLEQLGATVLLTRADDTFPSLGDRVTALNTLHPDYFISIHHNSLELVSDLNEATGTEAYWFYDEGEAFANDLIMAVSSAADRKLRSAKYGYYYVTRSNICPATLLEVGFMTNPWEFESISDTDVIWAEAGAIAQTVYNAVAANG